MKKCANRILKVYFILYKGGDFTEGKVVEAGSVVKYG